jgi:hypothetical protein
MQLEDVRAVVVPGRVHVSPLRRNFAQVEVRHQRLLPLAHRPGHHGSVRGDDECVARLQPGRIAGPALTPRNLLAWKGLPDWVRHEIRAAPNPAPAAWVRRRRVIRSATAGPCPRR